MIEFFGLGMSSLLFLAMMASSGSVHAANDKKDSKDQARRLQQKINTLEQEKAQLVQAKSQLEGQLKDTTEQFNHTRQRVETATRKGASLDKALKEAEEGKAELAGKLVQAEQKMTETAETLRVTLEAKKQLEVTLSERTQEFSACTTKNESLHRLGIELIKQYQEKSCLSGLLQKEPLTQLKSTEVENMLEEYREKLDQELVKQQWEESQKSSQQKTEVQKPEPQKLEPQKLEPEKAQTEKAEQLKAEQVKAESLKARQQNNLDRISRKIKQFFNDMEW